MARLRTLLSKTEKPYEYVAIGLIPFAIAFLPAFIPLPEPLFETVSGFWMVFALPINASLSLFHFYNQFLVSLSFAAGSIIIPEAIFSSAGIALIAGVLIENQLKNKDVTFAHKKTLLLELFLMVILYAVVFFYSISKT